MSLYSLDYNIFINEFLPPDKRAPIMKAFLGANLTPVNTLHEAVFTTYRPEVLAKTKHNGQKIILEAVLNEVFNTTAPALIYIDNTGDDKPPLTFFNQFEGYPQITFYNQSEGQPGATFYNQSEAEANNDFIVYVPAAIYSAVGVAKIRAEVDRLRPYSTNYTVISY